MKTDHKPPVRFETVALFAVVTLLAAAFWLLTSATAIAGTCQVCHKGSNTLTFNCADVEYFRHLDHGDPMGPCGATRAARAGKAERR